jgi:hypothetical protein
MHVCHCINMVIFGENLDTDVNLGVGSLRRVTRMQSKIVIWQ